MKCFPTENKNKLLKQSILGIFILLIACGLTSIYIDFSSIITIGCFILSICVLTFGFVKFRKKIKKTRQYEVRTIDGIEQVSV
jgi:hypothetical protein